MEKKVTFAVPEDVEAQEPLLESKEYDSYAWVLQEDHPLRDHPTEAECHPEVSNFTKRCWTIVRRRWRERGLPLLCLVLMFFVIIQLLVQLPYMVSFALEPAHIEKLPGFIQTPATIAAAQEVDHSSTVCVFESPLQVEGQGEIQGETNDAVEYALAAGCAGVKVDLWLREGDLLVGGSSKDLDHERTLQSSYLESLQAQLDAKNHASDTNGGNEPVGLFEEDPEQSITLFLDIQTPMRKAWPILVEQLRTMDKSGYLSYRDAKGNVVSRPVTVVVSGRGCRRHSLVDDLARALKGLF